MASASLSMLVSSPGLSQGHLSQSEGFTVQSQTLSEGCFRGQLEGFTDQSQFERSEESPPERGNAGKEPKPHFSGDSPHGS